MPRLFYAADLPMKIKEKITSAAESLRNLGPHVRLVSSGSYHMTLLFLGDQPDSGLESLISIGNQAVSGARECRLKIGPAGFFPRVSFLTQTGETETLTVISTMLGSLCQDFLEEPEARKFKAHVTLARHKEKITAQEKLVISECFRHLDGENYSCREIILFESDLTPQGAVYTKLATFPFSG